ncbi:MAG: hypothetical protein HS100_20920 [Anaerolineales bacterium]|nr:hypothetical protein [Anaerolineales bacterium]MCK6584920.1 hypothetical protein [Anaerolineales bacterium]
MNNKTTTAVSGCLIWFLLITIIGSCIMPVAFAVGGVTSSTDFVIVNVGAFLCPEGTAPRSYSYQTTTTDEYGNTRPSTAYELHCEDSNGEVVEKDPIAYAFIWIGICAVIGLIISAVLTFILAVPGGMLVTKVLNSLRGRAPSVTP